MPPLINLKQAPRVAGLELNALGAAGVLPPLVLKGARIADTASAVYDINGEVLFYRVPMKGEAITGFADVAAFPGFGEALLRVSHGMEWNEKALITAAEKAAKKLNRNFRAETSRFVAYSYPKIAVQFLIGDNEVGMFEIGSNAPIPAAPRREANHAPGHLERWSLIAEQPAFKAAEGEKRIKERLAHWDELSPTGRPPVGFDPHVLMPDVFKTKFPPPPIALAETKQVSYYKDNGGHSPCFELRGQETPVWCVGASVQMLLNFYRYYYTQEELAIVLGLGTPAAPNGLPFSECHKVVDTIENLTVNALDATMNDTPTFDEFRDEVRANRPLVSFIWGHSRAVAGFTTVTHFFPWHTFRGLLVYDPWPPNLGVITQWENYDAMSYFKTYNAHPKHVAISLTAGVLVGEHW